MKTPKFWYQPFSWKALLLWPVSLLFRLIVFIRQSLYRLHILPSHKFKLPVIVVGNITAGGSGKTPLVCALSHFLFGPHIRPVIVSKGYGGSFSGVKVVEKTDKASEVGDEALLLALKARCPVVISKKRKDALKKIVEDNLGSLVICDDGLQHYALKRDIEITVLDGDKRLGNGCLLPAGPLREPASRLKSVDIVVARGEPKPGEYGMQYLAHQFKHLTSGAVAEAGEFAGKSLLAMAGIAFPDRFFETLRSLGLEFEEKAFADHHAFSADDLKGLDADIVLMTEKDAVKIKEFADERCWVLPIEASLQAGFFDAVFDRVTKIK